MLDDPLMLALLAAILLFFFFIYLMIRRTMTGFREGMQKGQR